MSRVQSDLTTVSNTYKPKEGLTLSNPHALSTVQERVVLCVDESASMEWAFGKTTRIEALAQSVRAILAASNPTQTAYSLVSFSHAAQLVEPMTTNYTQMERYPFKIKSSTAMHEGLVLSATQRPNRIILLSDGEPDNPEDTLHVARSLAGQGIKVDTIAIGDADQTLMKTISELTGGIFRFATTPEDLVQSFVQLETTNRLKLEHKP